MPREAPGLSPVGDWVPYLDDDCGRVYWRCSVTGMCQWDTPPVHAAFSAPVQPVVAASDWNHTQDTVKSEVEVREVVVSEGEEAVGRIIGVELCVPGPVGSPGHTDIAASLTTEVKALVPSPPPRPPGPKASQSSLPSVPPTLPSTHVTSSATSDSQSGTPVLRASTAAAVDVAVVLEGAGGNGAGAILTNASPGSDILHDAAFSTCLVSTLGTLQACEAPGGCERLLPAHVKPPRYCHAHTYLCTYNMCQPHTLAHCCVSHSQMCCLALGDHPLPCHLPKMFNSYLVCRI